MSRRARVRMTLTAAVGAVALAIAAPTSASAQPIAGCPGHWSTTSALNHQGQLVFGGLWLATDANEQIAAPGFDLTAGDSNQDGYICVMFLEHNDRFDPAFVFTDNNVRGPRP